MRYLWPILTLIACAAYGAADKAAATNWVLPIFTDKEGHRSLTARGSEVRPLPADMILVTDLNITVFSGDAAARVDTVILSSLATFDPKKQAASGDKSVRIIRDDLIASGTRWTYDHNQKHVTMRGNVHVSLKAQLDNLLK